LEKHSVKIPEYFVKSVSTQRLFFFQLQSKNIAFETAKYSVSFRFTNKAFLYQFKVMLIWVTFLQFVIFFIIFHLLENDLVNYSACSLIWPQVALKEIQIFAKVSVVYKRFMPANKMSASCCFFC